MTAITPKANSVTHFSQLWVKLADWVISLKHSHKGNNKQIGSTYYSSTIELFVIAIQLGMTEGQTERQNKHLFVEGHLKRFNTLLKADF